LKGEGRGEMPTTQSAPGTVVTPEVQTGALHLVRRESTAQRTQTRNGQ